jgi:hypothetical protein
MYFHANSGQSGWVNHVILLLLIVAAFVALACRLVRTIRGDGYGRRPPPPSRWDDDRAAGPFRGMM